MFSLSLLLFHLRTKDNHLLAHIGLAKYCTHIKMGLILSLVSSSLHILIVGIESRVADILCQTALKYAQCGIIHRQQYPLTLAPISKSKHRSLIASGKLCSRVQCLIILCLLFVYLAGSIALSTGGITYLENINNLSKSQIKQLLSGKAHICYEECLGFFSSN